MSAPDQHPREGSGTRARSRRQGRRKLALLALVTAGFALAGCESPSPGPTESPTTHAASPPAHAESPTVRPGEMSSAGDQLCPSDLPIADDPSGHGFGVERAAEELPSLLQPQEAWVCRYDSFDRAAASSGGVVLGWRLAGRPEPVATADLPDLRAALEELNLPDPNQACTDDLGPRWMVVYSHDGDLTGLVVDDFGCLSVRLTDRPHTTPPGEQDQEGAVGGVLGGGAAVLEALGLGRSA